MNKKWDYDVPSVEFWKEVLRVLKPGGHLLSFGGTRTYHRMTVNIEDAGFEIRDCIQWLYGSGFPKSHNIGKAIDKLEGNDREVVGIDENFIKKNPNNTGINRLVTDENGVNKDNRKKQAIKNENAGIITKGNSEWEGWGTSLKPANEPIVLARKPLEENTVAENVLKYRTGGINIDDSRIPADKNLINHANKYREYGESKGDNSIFGVGGEFIDYTTTGRFPANIILDESAAEELDKQSGNSKSVKGRNDVGKSTYGGNSLQESKTVMNNSDRGFNDEGGASRFFYIAKVSKKERNLGIDKNIHPTVKPISLMYYLCKLITPPNGTILDPYMGSGSTGIASQLGGFNFVGMEMEEEYFNIASSRINNYEEYRQFLKK
jgi:site-specific DNA-methyltransferase (adenine-specific)